MAHDLFSPLRLGALDLSNRVVMAPMTRNRSPGGVPNALNAEYYAQRADAGLIVSEGTTPDSSGRGYIDIPGLFDAAQVAGWRAVGSAVHAKGGRIFVQLMHTGRISHPDFLDGAQPVAPSAIAAPGDIVTHAGLKPHGTPRALETHEIRPLAETFGRAARLGRRGGARRGRGARRQRLPAQPVPGPQHQRPHRRMGRPGGEPRPLPPRGGGQRRRRHRRRPGRRAAQPRQHLQRHQRTGAGGRVRPRDRRAGEAAAGLPARDG
jgi:hypothetical protein